MKIRSQCLERGPRSKRRRIAMRGEAPVANDAVRRITKLDRWQVNRLTHALAREGNGWIDGHWRGARYVFTVSPDPEGG